MRNSLDKAIERVLLSEKDIQQRVKDLGEQINADYADAGSLLLVGVLKGAFLFMADLVRQLTIPHSVEFIALSSYNKKASSSGDVRLIMDARTALRDRHVLIIEDIIDTGYTLDYLMRIFQARHPASLRACVLLDKPERREVEVPVHYLGFNIPDAWVVGYGMDYGDRYRTLPYIAVLKRQIYEK